MVDDRTIGVIFTGGKGMICRLVRWATSSHIAHVAVDVGGVVLHTTLDGDCLFPREGYLRATPRVRCCVWIPIQGPFLPFGTNEEAYPLARSLVRWLTTIQVPGASDCIGRVADTLRAHGVGVPRRATRTAARLHAWLLTQGFRHECAFQRPDCRPHPATP